MDRASYFIKDRAIFGSFPTQEAVDELENKGVKFFVNLTHNYEKKITPYVTNHNYITFPISDHRVPQDWKNFACFIIRISDIILSLKAGELLYIHCKGGHGRSGVVVACLLCHIFTMTPEQALEQTTKSHSRRSVMREKWRKLGSPQTFQQKNFVRKFFDPLHFYRAYLTGYTAGFSTFTMHRVFIDNINYPTSEAAIQAAKNPYNKDYVQKQQHARTPLISKNLGRKTEIREDWDKICDKIIYKITKCKFDQHNDIKENLLNTGLRPIIQHSKGDSYWGDGGDGTGQNRMGKILSVLREQYYRESM
jgi:ribA/ribD-fused uncharacterized protein